MVYCTQHTANPFSQHTDNILYRYFIRLHVIQIYPSQSVTSHVGPAPACVMLAPESADTMRTSAPRVHTQ